MKIKKILIILPLFLLIIFKPASSKSDWLSIVGFVPENPLMMNKPEVFWGVFGAAALSYGLAEFVFDDSENLNFYQVRAGMNNEYVWGYRRVMTQNFGVENRVASWFAIAAEFNMQEWIDNTPTYKNESSFGMGMGLMTYYRWYLFGSKCISPYLEYGAGLFYGFGDFPVNGSNFTFNHSTQIGLEYTFDNKNKLRFSYGNFNQSNYGLLEHNPGYDASGFNLSFSWFWKTSKW
jgi:hypothetical protein